MVAPESAKHHNMRGTWLHLPAGYTQAHDCLRTLSARLEHTTSLAHVMWTLCDRGTTILLLLSPYVTFVL